MADDKNNQTIIRGDYGENHRYFIGARSWAQDERLTYVAVGIMAYLFSKYGEWKLKVYDLIRDKKRPDYETGVVTDKSRPVAGRDLIYAALDELAFYGYLIKPQKKQDDKGRWKWTPYIVYECPCEGYPHTGNPKPGEPYTDKAEIKEKNIDSLNQDYKLEIQRLLESLAADSAAPVAFLFNDHFQAALKNKDLPEKLIYIGRGKREICKRSKWANPYQVGKHGDAAAVMQQYREFLLSSSALLGELGQLTGRGLICHDENDAAVLIEMWTRFVQDGEAFPGEAAPKHRNLMFEVLAAAYDNSNAGHVVKLVQYYEGRTSVTDGKYHQFRLRKAMTAAETIGFVQWRLDVSWELPRAAETLKRAVEEFRGIRHYGRYMAFGAQWVAEWQDNPDMRFNIECWCETLVTDPKDEKAAQLIQIWLKYSHAAVADSSIYTEDAAAIVKHELGITPEEFAEYCEFLEKSDYAKKYGFPSIKTIGTKLPLRVLNKRNENGNGDNAHIHADNPNSTPDGLTDIGDLKARLQAKLGGKTNDGATA